MTAFSNPYQPPQACKTFTTTASDQDTSLTVGSGVNKRELLPQFAIVGSGSGSLVLEYTRNGLGDDTQTVSVGKYIGGGFDKIDGTSTNGIEITCYY